MTQEQLEDIVELTLKENYWTSMGYYDIAEAWRVVRERALRGPRRCPHCNSTRVVTVRVED